MSDNERKLTEADLVYAATARCPCGAGLAYVRRRGPCVSTHWDCAAILLGTAIPQGEPGAVEHTGQLSFLFYEVKSERQPSASGATTRPPKKGETMTEADLVYAAYERCKCGAGLAHVRAPGKRASVVWECSHVLLNPTMPFDTNAHTAPRPLAFFPIIGEGEQAARGASTRPKAEETHDAKQ